MGIKHPTFEQPMDKVRKAIIKILETNENVYTQKLIGYSKNNSKRKVYRN
jgi:hypothetical protein